MSLLEASAPARQQSGPAQSRIMAISNRERHAGHAPDETISSRAVTNDTSVGATITAGNTGLPNGSTRRTETADDCVVEGDSHGVITIAIRRIGDGHRETRSAGSAWRLGLNRIPSRSPKDR